MSFFAGIQYHLNQTDSHQRSCILQYLYRLEMHKKSSGLALITTRKPPLVKGRRNEEDTSTTPRGVVTDYLILITHARYLVLCSHICAQTQFLIYYYYFLICNKVIEDLTKLIRVEGLKLKLFFAKFSNYHLTMADSCHHSIKY